MLLGNFVFLILQCVISWLSRCRPDPKMNTVISIIDGGLRAHRTNLMRPERLNAQVPCCREQWQPSLRLYHLTAPSSLISVEIMQKQKH